MFSAETEEVVTGVVEMDDVEVKLLGRLGSLGGQQGQGNPLKPVKRLVSSVSSLKKLFAMIFKRKLFQGNSTGKCDRVTRTGLKR